MSLLRMFARPLLAAPFVLSGIDALKHPENHRERARTLTPLLNKAGVELDDSQIDMATRAMGATNIVCSCALSVGKLPRLSAAILAGIQIPVTLANAPFWLHKGEQRRADVAQLASQAGLLGGLLLAAVDLAGRPSLTWRFSNAKSQRSALRDVRESEREASSEKLEEMSRRYEAKLAKARTDG
ncbi:DoxX family membrane protein [Arcanobacterium haemolyticum]|nr:DoxX family membrane protein [Arcanobacterium haemolyticum]